MFPKAAALLLFARRRIFGKENAIAPEMRSPNPNHKNTLAKFTVFLEKETPFLSSVTIVSD